MTQIENGVTLNISDLPEKVQQAIKRERFEIFEDYASLNMSVENFQKIVEKNGLERGTASPEGDLCNGFDIPLVFRGGTTPSK